MTTKINADPNGIANVFATLLKGWLDDDEWREVIRRVKEQPGSMTACPSHDFCDANVVMAEAIRQVALVEVDVTNDAHCDLWRRSWDVFHAHVRTGSEG